MRKFPTVDFILSRIRNNIGETLMASERENSTNLILLTTLTVKRIYLREDLSAYGLYK